MLCLSRKLIAACLLVAGMAGVGFAQTAVEAKPYVSQDGHYHVLFPGEPQVATEAKTVGAGVQVDMHMASLEKNDGKLAYMAMYSELPADVLKAQIDQGMTDDDRLANCAAGFINGIAGRVITTRPIRLPGVVGKEIEFDRTDGTKGVYRVYVGGGRIYQLFVGWNGAVPPAGDVSDFLDSFALDR